MLEYALTVFTLSLLLVTCSVFFYMRSYLDHQNRFFSKIGNLLLYGYLKLCITWEYGKQYVSLTLRSIFTSYHMGDDHIKEIEQKQQELLQVKNSIHHSLQNHKKNATYNLKILK